MTLKLGSHYTREQIHSLLGGSVQSFLPTAGGRVVCGAFRTDLNPDAPATVLPGKGPGITKAARLLARQRGPIPVFIRRTAGMWEYVGKWTLDRMDRDPAEVERQARRAGREGDVFAVMHFLPAGEENAAAAVSRRPAAGTAHPAPRPTTDPVGAYREMAPKHLLKLADDVFRNGRDYLRWPESALLFAPGSVRRGNDTHTYSTEQLQQLQAAGIKPDARSNGPAIMAFLLAGGKRPRKADGKHEWSIHHIYDGRFPAPGRDETTHAVKDGRWFTEAGGLVAIHPVADALASEVGYFAWLLRREAWLRFGIDPDGVFPVRQGPSIT